MFKNRSQELELLDLENIKKKDLFQNLKELEIINKYLFGIYTSIKGIELLIKDKNKTYEIYDIGCGGGDFLKYIAKWAKKKSLKVNLVGVDLKKDCIEYAKNNCKDFPNIRFMQSDFNDILSSENKPDIIHASLFFHHLRDEDIINFLHIIKLKKVDLIINDLIRNSIAYYSIKYLTKLFSKSYLVQNDAPLSVLKGFKKFEWENKLKKIESLGCSYKVISTIGFRHLIIIKNNL